MRRIRITLQYDGSAFKGWQVQPTGITVQGVLEDRVFRLTGERTAVIAAGRTDAGVHAIEQVVAFNTISLLSLGVIKRALNATLPPDVRVVDIAEADINFHPRRDARSKRYSYIIANSVDIPVFIRSHSWWVRLPLDLDAMRNASSCLAGSRDFSAFRGSGCGSNTPVKSISLLEIVRSDGIAFLFATLRGNFIRISIEADAFLRHMVRNIVGTLVEVGMKRMPPEKVKDILESKDRRLAGPTAPPQGLFLEKVMY